MTSLGIALHELREAKGVSLDDVARSTRVGRRYLEALESDSLGELPPPVFVKGFIRAYCEFLEASPEEPLRMYREAVGETVRPERVQKTRHTGPSRRGGSLVIAAVLFVALGVSLFAVRIGLKGSSPQAPSVPAEPARAPAAAPEPAGQHLLIRAVEPTWIRVQVDEGQVAEELMQAGAVREWTAVRRFVLTVGNAGGLEVDLNGRRIPALGARGAVIQRLVLPAEAQGAGS
jgi:cytoskeleton protein RodZ